MPKLYFSGAREYINSLDNRVAIRLHHLSSGAYSLGLPKWHRRRGHTCFLTAEQDILTCMYTQKEMKRNLCVHSHTQSHSHTSQRLCESQKAEPEGCCVSDVCIVYSVVPVHVGDCCTLRPHSSHVLFTMTGVDSRLLSRRTERPSKKRVEKRRQRSKETESDH